MIIFVDNEHELAYEKPWGEMMMAARVRIKYRLEDISGEPCLIVRYNQVDPDLWRRFGVKAVLVSGNSADASEYTASEQEGLRALFLEKSLPIFGFCGGFQLLAETFGAELAPIGPLAPDEPEAEAPPGFGAGMKKEFGYMPVNISASHPLFEGIGEQPIMRQAHFWEIKSVPPEFKPYAASQTTPIQMLIHDSLPIMGTQFHPEYYTDEHPAGKQLITNFFKAAGIIE